MYYSKGSQQINCIKNRFGNYDKEMKRQKYKLNKILGLN